MRWSRAGSWTVVLSVPVAIGALALPAVAVPQVAIPRETVTAVVVKSWSRCSHGSMWPELNNNWSSYGTVPVSIIWNDLDLCKGAFTLADLESSGADVVILDDTAGGNHKISLAEVEALRTYAEEGHDLVGAYLVFRNYRSGVDNSAVAPLFGLHANRWDETTSTQATYTMNEARKAAKPLIQNLPNPYVSRGYPYAQVPGDGLWGADDLAGAKLVGVSDDRTHAITVYRQPLYNAVYIASMPSYLDWKQDAQFLYNAITYPKMS
jgi:hypothetical protein